MRASSSLSPKRSVWLVCEGVGFSAARAKTFVDSAVAIAYLQSYTITHPIPIMASDTIITLTEANFESEIANSTVPVIVDFWAEWCGPCRMLGPILDDLAKDQAGKVKIGKVNVDEAPALAAKFNVRSIPMIVFFKDGAAKDTVVGVQSKDALAKRLAALG